MAGNCFKHYFNINRKLFLRHVHVRDFAIRVSPDIIKKDKFVKIVIVFR
jgi:hypothetical protein